MKAKKKDKSCSSGCWFNPVVVDWIVTCDLSVSFAVNCKKGAGLSGLNDWRSPACIT